LELTCTYRSFARYGDKLLVKTTLNDISYSRISFIYEVVRDGDTDSKSGLIAIGKTFHAFADRELKPVNMKKYNPELFQIIRMEAPV
jgi:acyl-CoA thioester hydrolase